MELIAAREGDDMNEATTTTRTHVRDPICGMDVDPATAADRVDHDGTTYYFCGARCADTFRKDPEGALAKVSKPIQKRQGGDGQPATKAAGNYICPMCPGVESEEPAACPKCGMALEPAAPMTAQRQVQYTCPMHPEVLQDEPGECPKCGMALEPTTVPAEEKNPELVDMTRRFWVGAVLTLPVLVLAMGSYLPFVGPLLERVVPSGLGHWLELAFATPVVLWAGWPFFQRGWKSVVTWNLSLIHI